MMKLDINIASVESGSDLRKLVLGLQKNMPDETNGINTQQYCHVQ